MVVNIRNVKRDLMVFCDVAIKRLHDKLPTCTKPFHTGLYIANCFCMPGDPALYHAHSIVLVLSPEEEVTVSRLAAHNRVGTTAKKRVLWSSVDGSGRPFYLTQWWGGHELAGGEEEV